MKAKIPNRETLSPLRPKVSALSDREFTKMRLWCRPRWWDCQLFWHPSKAFASGKTWLFYCYIWRLEVCDSGCQPSRGCVDCTYNPLRFESSFAVLRSNGTQKPGCLHKNIFTALCPGIKTRFLEFLSVSPVLTKFICECHRV